MKIRMISWYFGEKVATVYHFTSLAEYLSEQGHQVEVWCAKANYRGKRAEPINEAQKVKVKYLSKSFFGKSSIVFRICDFVIYLAMLCFYLLFSPKPDVYLVHSTPPLASFFVTLLNPLRKAKIVIASCDLHPDGLQALKNRRWTPLLDLISKLIIKSYKNADKVVTVGRCIKQRLILKGTKQEKIEVFQPWFSARNFEIIEKSENYLAQKFDCSDKFVVLYTGNAGLAHTFDEINFAALTLQEQKDILFLFIGGGKRTSEIIAFKEKHQLENIKIADYLPFDELKYSFNLADVHIVTLKKEWTGISVPSKLFAVLASGKPVIFIGDEESECALTITENNCGFVVEPGNVQQLVKIFEKLHSDKDLCKKLGANSKQAYFAKFDESVILPRWHKTLRTISFN